MHIAHVQCSGFSLIRRNLTSAWLVREHDGGYRRFSGEGQWSTQSLLTLIGSSCRRLSVCWSLLSVRFCIHDATAIKLSAIPLAVPLRCTERSRHSTHFRGIRGRHTPIVPAATPNHKVRRPPFAVVIASCCRQATRGGGGQLQWPCGKRA